MLKDYMQKVGTQNLYNYILASDFKCFLEKSFQALNPTTKYLHNWHIDEIKRYLKACEDGEIKRLIINIPPRYLKSLTVNVAWAAWLLKWSRTEAPKKEETKKFLYCKCTCPFYSALRARARARACTRARARAHARGEAHVARR